VKRSAKAALLGIEAQGVVGEEGSVKHESGEDGPRRVARGILEGV